VKVTSRLRPWRPNPQSLDRMRFSAGMNRNACRTSRTISSTLSTWRGINLGSSSVMAAADRAVTNTRPQPSADGRESSRV